MGPLLFVVFFNDLVENLNCHVIKYADDTVLYYANKDIDVIEKVLNSEMESVRDCRENELVLNLKKGKTEAMLFGTAKRVNSTVESLRSVIMVLRSLLCQSMSTWEMSLIVHLRYSLILIELINEQAAV